MRAVDAVRRAPEHQIVPRRTPGGLLHHIDIGHAKFGEQPFLLGDDQWRGVDKRDIAEDGFRRLGPCRHRDMGAKRKRRLGGGQYGSGPTTLEDTAP